MTVHFDWPLAHILSLSCPSTDLRAPHFSRFPRGGYEVAGLLVVRAVIVNFSVRQTGDGESGLSVVHT